MRRTLFLLRGGAVAIAVLALLDPEVTLRRQVDAEVAVVRAPAAPGDGGPSLDALTDEVTRNIDSRFRAIPGPWGGAAATVLVGEGFPDGAAGLPSPLFRVVDDDALTRPHLVRLEAPARVHHPGRARLRLLLGHAPATESGPFPTVVLRWEGAEVDRTTARPRGGFLEAVLDFVAPGPGVYPLEVALAGDAPDRHRSLAHPVVRVVDERWAVLFLDPRPAWGSTFVRRALSDDPRFLVTGRIETAPGVVTTFGSPPAAPEAPGALEPHDLIVVGAPERLSAPLASALEGWVRGGGSLILLPDDLPEDGAPPRPWEELAGVSAWVVEEHDDPLDLTLRGMPGDEPPEGPALRARLTSRPRVAPPGIRPWAVDGEGRPLIWSRPLGEGRVVVSGAHDAWHFRTEPSSDFARSWRAMAAEAAALVPPPLELHLAPGATTGAVAADLLPPPGGSLALPPGAPLRLSAVSRHRGAPGGSQGAPGVEGVVEAGDSEHPLAFRPTTTAGVLEATFTAPDAPGTAWIEVNYAGDRARLPLVVAPRAAEADPGSDPAFLALWSRARGGALFPAREGDALVDALEAALDLERRPEGYHPMRSPWWIVPFALLLAGEWWIRRRRGLP